MTDRPRRNIQRFDFAIYGSNGQKVPPPLDDMSTQSTSDQAIKMEEPPNTDSLSTPQSVETDQQSLVTTELNASPEEESPDTASQEDESPDTASQASVTPKETRQSDKDLPKEQPLAADPSTPPKKIKPFIQSPPSAKRDTKPQLNQVYILQSDIELCLDEVTDLIDEHSIQNASIKDTESILTELKELRKGLRANAKTFSKLAPEEYKSIQPNIQHVLDLIKDFNVKAKGHIDEANAQVSNTVVESTKFKNELEAMMFSANDIVDHINELKSSLDIDITNFDDSELLQCKTELPIFDTKLSTIADRYERLIKFPVMNIELSKLIANIGKAYKDVKAKKSLLASKVKSAIQSGEVMKFKSFDEAKLGIDLQKFSGYESKTDIYTFKSEFEKINLRNTPKLLLGDLLINNYLSEPALSLVKGMTDINLIWKRLIHAYGNTKVLLTKKLKELNSLDSVSKSKDPAKIMSFITQLINTIKDLVSLAKTHDIENNLYFGDGLNNIYALLGDARCTRWFSSVCDLDLNEKQQWSHLIDFLEKEVKVQQQRALINLQDDKPPKKPSLPRGRGGYHTPSPNPPTSSGSSSGSATGSSPGSATGSPNGGSTGSPSGPATGQSNGPSTGSSQPKCNFCDGKCKDQHVPTKGPGGSMVIQYFACKDFTDKTPAERLSTLWKKGLCHQCLLPGAKRQDSKHKNGQCQHDFICKHPSHQQYTVKHHVLVCEEHKASQENEELLNKFKSRFINRNPSLQSFSRDIQLSFFTANGAEQPSVVGIYLLQQITVNNQTFTVFFDNGCSDFVIRKDAVERLGRHATKVGDGSFQISGIGGATTSSNHGVYTVNIPLANGQLATMTGVCLDKLTQTFPTYQLGEAESTIRQAFHGDPSYLPKLPKSVGGDVDMMIGMEYFQFHPHIIFKMANGLSIFESVFNGADGSLGIIGGPHQSFAESHKHHFGQFNTSTAKSNLSYQSLVAFDTSCFHINSMNNFEVSENVGSEISYRCVTCRDCKACKNQIEDISIKEEVEQDLIKKSITIDTESKIVTAKLPFIHEPSVKLSSNEDKALKIYYQQLRKLNKAENLTDKQEVILSEKKMQDLGFVDYVENLPESIQQSLSTQLHHFIPWRAVWKPNSVSTPCRVVFDASSPTPTGFSLNDILAKGINSLNRLQDIALRWRIHASAFTTDVRKMYNTIRLDPSHWQYQRYLWQEDLSFDERPKQKVIKTLIYGVRSSGNQAEYALREVAKLASNQFPEASEIVHNDMYVDDCISGDLSNKLTIQRTQELETVSNGGGFMLKGVVISGEDPPTSMSEDGSSVFVAGMKWWPKDDQLSIHIPPMNFSAKRRGKKPTLLLNQIPDKLTRRHCVSRTGEIFDLLGLLCPITASLKLDLHQLVTRKLDWDDQIPDDLRPLWISNFEMMEELNSLRFNRTIVPEDATNLDLTTVDFADASKSLMCVSIYARFKRRCGSYSSQLVFSRSKLVPEGTSQPRAELLAALLNAHTSEIVRRSFKKWHQSSTKLTDSQITLYWICNETKSLKQYVRSRVIDILRFTSRKDWYHIKGPDMLADIGTRRGTSTNEINNQSEWFNGSAFLALELNEMPIKTVSEIKMSAAEEREAQLETYNILTVISFVVNSPTSSSKIAEEVQKRLQFSNYIINPNKYRFNKVLRILALVIKFIHQLRLSHKGFIKLHPNSSLKDVLPTEEEIRQAKLYFFTKSTEELKHFTSSKKFQDISHEKDGIIYHTERVLNMDDTTIVGRFNQNKYGSLKCKQT